MFYLDSIFNRKTLATLSVLFLLPVTAFAMFDDHGFGGGFGLGYGRSYMDKSSLKILQKIQSRESMWKQIDKLGEKITQLEEIADRSGLEQRRLQEYIEQRDSLLSQLKKINKVSGPEMLLARGLAGSDWEMLDDCDVNGWSDALQKGLLVLGSKKLSDVLGRRMEGALESTVGSCLDIGFKKLIDTCSFVSNLIFHRGNDPFTIQEIDSWKKLTKEILDDIEKMLKDGLKDSLRGHDFTARPVLDEQDADLDDEKLKEEERDFIWTALMEGYAEQFEKMIEVFKARKRYYGKTSLVIFYVDQLTKRLAKLVATLTSSKTLKDFDTALHSSKAIFIAYRKNIVGLLDRLADDEDIRPQSYSLAGKGAYNKSSSKPSTKDTGFGGFTENDNAFMPNGFGGFNG